MIKNHEDINERAFLLMIRDIVALILWISIIFVIFYTLASAHTLYPGQWAQIDPSEREWLRTQKVPGGTVRCCNESDGTYAQEDIREGHYWTRFTWHHYGDGDNVIHEVDSDWMQVPDEAVIHDPNRNGAPVVWWAWQGGFGDQAKVYIRCYAPGGGV